MIPNQILIFAKKKRIDISIEYLEKIDPSINLDFFQLMNERYFSAN